MKKALLILSHGSRRAASNEEVFALTARVRELAVGRLNEELLVGHASRIRERVIDTGSLNTEKPVLQNPLMVDCAFLEITEPTVQQKIDELAAAGVTDIQVFPHFLAAGMHVTKDIPHEIETAQNKYPAILFKQLPHLGALSDLPSLITQLIETK
jgi:sirohydrochlorin ferrochelatase